jgi:SAM-dependent methyltransferase
MAEQEGASLQVFAKKLIDSAGHSNIVTLAELVVGGCEKQLIGLFRGKSTWDTLTCANSAGATVEEVEGEVSSEPIECDASAAFEHEDGERTLIQNENVECVFVPPTASDHSASLRTSENHLQCVCGKSWVSRSPTAQHCNRCAKLVVPRSFRCPRGGVAFVRREFNSFDGNAFVDGETQRVHTRGSAAKNFVTAKLGPPSLEAAQSLFPPSAPIKIVFDFPSPPGDDTDEPAFLAVLPALFEWASFSQHPHLLKSLGKCKLAGPKKWKTAIESTLTPLRCALFQSLAGSQLTDIELGEPLLKNIDRIEELRSSVSGGRERREPGQDGNEETMLDLAGVSFFSNSRECKGASSSSSSAEQNGGAPRLQEDWCPGSETFGGLSLEGVYHDADEIAAHDLPSRISPGSILSASVAVSSTFEKNVARFASHGVVFLDARSCCRDPAKDAWRSTGLADTIQERLKKLPRVAEMVSRIVREVEAGRSVVVFCTRGRHRSVAIAELAAKALGYPAVENFEQPPRHARHLSLDANVASRCQVLLGSGFTIAAPDEYTSGRGHFPESSSFPTRVWRLLVAFASAPWCLVLGFANFAVGGSTRVIYASLSFAHKVLAVLAGVGLLAVVAGLATLSMEYFVFWGVLLITVVYVFLTSTVGTPAIEVIGVVSLERYLGAFNTVDVEAKFESVLSSSKKRKAPKRRVTSKGEEVASFLSQKLGEVRGELVFVGYGMSQMEACIAREFPSSTVFQAEASTTSQTIPLAKINRQDRFHGGGTVYGTMEKNLSATAAEKVSVNGVVHFHNIIGFDGAVRSLFEGGDLLPRGEFGPNGECEGLKTLNAAFRQSPFASALRLSTPALLFCDVGMFSKSGNPLPGGNMVRYRSLLRLAKCRCSHVCFKVLDVDAFVCANAHVRTGLDVCCFKPPSSSQSSSEFYALVSPCDPSVDTSVDTTFLDGTLAGASLDVQLGLKSTVTTSAKPVRSMRETVGSSAACQQLFGSVAQPEEAQRKFLRGLSDPNRSGYCVNFPLTSAVECTTLLDIGCGSGMISIHYVAELLRRGLEPPTKIVGVDISAACTDAFEKNLRRYLAIVGVNAVVEARVADGLAVETYRGVPRRGTAVHLDPLWNAAVPFSFSSTSFEEFVAFGEKLAEVVFVRAPSWAVPASGRCFEYLVDVVEPPDEVGGLSQTLSFAPDARYAGHPIYTSAAALGLVCVAYLATAFVGANVASIVIAATGWYFDATLTKGWQLILLGHISYRIYGWWVSGTLDRVAGGLLWWSVVALLFSNFHVPVPTGLSMTIRIARAVALGVLHRRDLFYGMYVRKLAVKRTQPGEKRMFNPLNAPGPGGIVVTSSLDFNRTMQQGLWIFDFNPWRTVVLYVITLTSARFSAHYEGEAYANGVAANLTEEFASAELRGHSSSVLGPYYEALLQGMGTEPNHIRALLWSRANTACYWTLLITCPASVLFHVLERAWDVRRDLPPMSNIYSNDVLQERVLATYRRLVNHFNLVESDRETAILQSVRASELDNEGVLQPAGELSEAFPGVVARYFDLLPTGKGDYTAVRYTFTAVWIFDLVVDLATLSAPFVTRLALFGDLSEGKLRTCAKFALGRVGGSFPYVGWCVDRIPTWINIGLVHTRVSGIESKLAVQDALRARTFGDPRSRRVCNRIFPRDQEDNRGPEILALFGEHSFSALTFVGVGRGRTVQFMHDNLPNAIPFRKVDLNLSRDQSTCFGRSVAGFSGKFPHNVSPHAKSDLLVAEHLRLSGNPHDAKVAHAVEEFRKHLHLYLVRGGQCVLYVPPFAGVLAESIARLCRDFRHAHLAQRSKNSAPWRRQHTLVLKGYQLPSSGTNVETLAKALERNVQADINELKYLSMAKSPVFDEAPYKPAQRPTPPDDGTFLQIRTRLLSLGLRLFSGRLFRTMESVGYVKAPCSQPNDVEPLYNRVFKRAIGAAGLSIDGLKIDRRRLTLTSDESLYKIWAAKYDAPALPPKTAWVESMVEVWRSYKEGIKSFEPLLDPILIRSWMCRDHVPAKGHAENEHFFRVSDTRCKNLFKESWARLQVGDSSHCYWSLIPKCERKLGTADKVRKPGRPIQYLPGPERAVEQAVLWPVQKHATSMHVANNIPALSACGGPLSAASTVLDLAHVFAARSGKSVDSLFEALLADATKFDRSVTSEHLEVEHACTSEGLPGKSKEVLRSLHRAAMHPVRVFPDGQVVEGGAMRNSGMFLTLLGNGCMNISAVASDFMGWCTSPVIDRLAPVHVFWVPENLHRVFTNALGKYGVKFSCEGRAVSTRNWLIAGKIFLHLLFLRGFSIKTSPVSGFGGLPEGFDYEFPSMCPILVGDDCMVVGMREDIQRCFRYFETEKRLHGRSASGFEYEPTTVPLSRASFCSHNFKICEDVHSFSRHVPHRRIEFLLDSALNLMPSRKGAKLDKREEESRVLSVAASFISMFPFSREVRDVFLPALSRAVDVPAVPELPFLHRHYIRDDTTSVFRSTCSLEFWTRAYGRFPLDPHAPLKNQYRSPEEVGDLGASRADLVALGSALRDEKPGTGHWYSRFFKDTWMDRMRKEGRDPILARGGNIGFKTILAEGKQAPWNFVGKYSLGNLFD